MKIALPLTLSLSPGGRGGGEGVFSTQQGTME